MIRVLRTISSVWICLILSHPVLAETLPGDGNGDGRVDSADQLILLNNWQKEVDLNAPVVTFDLPAPTIPLVRIPAGSFMMGSPETERGRDLDEGPLHQVTIDYDFYLGQTEVTQTQWRAVIGQFPNNQQDIPEAPIGYVTWDAAQEFLAALNAMVGKGTFRLPTEAEWEYACRAGTTGRFYFGDSLGCADDCSNCDAQDFVIGPGKTIGIPSTPNGPDLKGFSFLRKRSDYMWYCGNAGFYLGPARQLIPNSFGLYGMAGNVSEWCQDFYHASYISAPTDGSAWLEGTGPDRVLRGGNFRDEAGACRSASRVPGITEGYYDYVYGMRVAWTPG